VSQLRHQLEVVVNEFVSAVVSLMTTTSMLEFAREEDRRPPQDTKTRLSVRRTRASAAEVQRQKDVAFGIAKMLSPGFRKRDVMKRSDSKVDLGRALSLLVREGKLSRKGSRRAARYWTSE